MTSNGYYPKKLIYLGDNTENRKAILVSAPNEFTDVVLETIELSVTDFEDKYCHSCSLWSGVCRRQRH